jgi:hypothetical protein
MSKRVAILQSNYVPWKGYFDLIRRVDEFILFDDVLYTRRDWRNRNRIKTQHGVAWLTIPVQVKGGYLDQSIQDTVVSDPRWNTLHWKTIVHNYSRARYFKHYSEVFEQLYLGALETHLSLINHRFLTGICELLGISTKFSWSTDYAANAASPEGKTQRLIVLCQQAGATQYVSGPSARAYIDERLFQEADIQLSYMDYQGYPEYTQLYPPFEHAVSILDLILNEGPSSTNYMKSFLSNPHAG